MADTQNDSTGQTSSETFKPPPEDRTAQRGRLRRYLIERGDISTLEARQLGIMHPAGRIQELRRQGLDILTTRDKSAHKGRGRMARYVLRRETIHAEDR